MPIPKPNKGESQDDFLARCIPAIAPEFEDNDQRVAVCGSAWRDAKSENGFVSVAMELKGETRTETLQGRTFRVVPAVLVKSKVLHNNLGRTWLPPEAFTAEWAAMAGDAPVLIDHPTKRGQPVTGRDPAIQNERGIGRLFNVHVEDAALKGEVWIDESLQVPGLEAVLEKLDAGEPVENSTGFPVHIENVPGVVNGAAYDIVIHPIGFDHLAVFADKLGACSVTDGCGLGLNHAGPCDPDDAAIPVAPDPDIAPALAGNRGWRRIVSAVAAFLGFGKNESDEDRHELIRVALREKFGGQDVFLWPVATFSDEQQVVFERESPQDSGLFRVEFTIDEDGVVTFSDPVEVRRITTFEPVTNSGEHTTPAEGQNMNRDQMIAHLAEAGPLPADALAKLTDCQLKALMEAGKAPTANAESEPDAETWKARALRYRAERDDLKSKSENALNAEAEERVALLDDLLYKGKDVPWTENELEAMDIVQLRKVHRSVFNSRDFSGRGGPRTSATVGDFGWVKSVDQALMEKEAN